MAKIVFYILVATLISSCVAQDFEPSPLEDGKSANTTNAPLPETTDKRQNSTEKNTIDPSTDSPNLTTTKPNPKTEPDPVIEKTTPKPTDTTTTTTTTTKKPTVIVEPPNPVKTTTEAVDETKTTTVRPVEASTENGEEATRATTKIPSTSNEPLSPIETTTKSNEETTTLSDSYYIWRPLYPSYPGNLANGQNQCYFKKQLGYPQMRWTCGRLQYYTPVECYQCCRYPYSLFAGCNKVQNFYSNNGQNYINYYKIQ